MTGQTISILVTCHCARYFGALFISVIGSNNKIHGAQRCGLAPAIGPAGVAAMSVRSTLSYSLSKRVTC